MYVAAAQLTASEPADLAAAAAFTTRLLARRTLALTGKIDELNAQITAAIESHALGTQIDRRGLDRRQVIRVARVGRGRAGQRHRRHHRSRGPHAPAARRSALELMHARASRR